MPVGENIEWPDEGKAMMIFRSDMAYELGSGTLPAVGNTLITTEKEFVDDDKIILIGNDLPQIDRNTPYARITLGRVDENFIGTGDKLYNTIKNIGYFRYHIFPKGFMLRVSSSLEKESVRVARNALDNGLDFTSI